MCRVEGRLRIAGEGLNDTVLAYDVRRIVGAELLGQSSAVGYEPVPAKT